MATTQSAISRPKALIFDLMGTCLDWHSAITPILKEALSKLDRDRIPAAGVCEEDASDLALAWRQAFFDEIHKRFQAGEPPEDIDATHRRTLVGLLSSERWKQVGQMNSDDVDACVQAWHIQMAWPDVAIALERLKRECDVIVLANGTVRLQLDITKSSGLHFDMLLSSELLNITKPDPQAYIKAMELLKREPDECMMVAAHAYDVRAAKKVGMRTTYLQRWTEDLQEDMDMVKQENEIFIDARKTTAHRGGLCELADLLVGKAN